MKLFNKWFVAIASVVVILLAVEFNVLGLHHSRFSKIEIIFINLLFSALLIFLVLVGIKKVNRKENKF